MLSFETIQLNDSTIAYLTDLYPDDASIFAFGDVSSAGPSVVPETGCKAFPGETHWPSQEQWSLLASLTDDALIKGEPSAAVCYEDWPQYDLEGCASVTGKWGTPNFQYACSLRKLSRYFPQNVQLLLMDQTGPMNLPDLTGRCLKACHVYRPTLQDQTQLALLGGFRRMS